MSNIQRKKKDITHHSTNIAQKPLKEVRFGAKQSQISNSLVYIKLKNVDSRANLNWDVLFTLTL